MLVDTWPVAGEFSLQVMVMARMSGPSTVGDPPYGMNEAYCSSETRMSVMEMDHSRSSYVTLPSNVDMPVTSLCHRAVARCSGCC